jgi:2-polyprenyl-3-methyl-5-hydroxy-6-metoxy-1,4-benzoquinol methylase
MATIDTILVNVSSQEEKVAAQSSALVEKMTAGVFGFFMHYAIYLGVRLEYYTTLARHEDLNSTELAALTGTNERYTREWLEQQVMYGILEVQDANAGPYDRRFSLPAGHAEVLTMRDSLFYMAPISPMLVGTARPIDQLLEAFRSGGGVAYELYGKDMREGIAGMNRGTFIHELGQTWIPAMKDVHERLQQPGARVADFGCGFGWSSIAIAKSYPQASIDGFDLDAPSIDEAKNNAIEYGVNERVNFQVRDAADPDLAGHYDLVTAFECIHDMSNPVGALRTIRRLINGTGSVLVVDERVGETFAPGGPDNDVDWLMYGFSIMHCLPVGMVEESSAGTGTVMRPNTLRQYAQEAGFSRVEILPVENLFFRLYRLIA